MSQAVITSTGTDPTGYAARPHRFAEVVPLLLVLVVQAAFTLRLHNTAFQDEALYLYAGHRQIEFMLHGIPTYDNYASYFSGAPWLYPVLVAAVDGVFELEGARLLSLLFLLATTCLLYGVTRRLFGRPEALAAAAGFALCAPTLFVGRLATYDAAALFLLALATWITVRTAALPWPVSVLAAPVIVLAGATKYAAVLFVPSIVVLGMLADAMLKPTPRPVWRRLRPMARAAVVLSASVALALLLLRIAGPSFVTGLRATTTARAHGTDSIGAVLAKSVIWGGPLFVVAVAGAVLLLLTRRSSIPGWSRAALAVLLTGTALLAPVYQVYLHTLVSLQKHLDFGLFFAAPLAGLAVARLLGVGLRSSRRFGAALGVCLLIAGSGLASSAALYREWPDAAPLVEVLRTQVRPVTGRYLVEESEVPRYYLASLAEPYQWVGTYFFAYKGQTGAPAYRAAIADRYFDLIVLRYGPTAALDHEIDGDLVARRGYELIARVPYTSGFGAGAYSVWRAVH